MFGRSGRLAGALLVTTLLLATAAPAAAEPGPGRGHGRGTTVTVESEAGVAVSGPGIDGTRSANECTTRPSGWAAPLSGSAWIGAVATCTDGVSAGEFRYATTFTLAADPAGLGDLRLAGSVLADDSVRVELNGNAVFPAGGGFGGGAASGSSFETTNKGFFRQGENTLTFVVSNGGGASGLDFTATVTASAAVLDEDTAAGTTTPQAGETHGQCVSRVARSTPPGPGHGRAVRDAAHSCR